ncbi:lipase (alpha beta-hydrolase fold family protein) [Colletotrichum incanum]|uniref:Lipase (Alpha beta-hydrolase fold family protein) n=1 Tax=Colletotrichum incanum TaxID=1573173 RepID=A0A162Q762_COLIC|nr:lipase (alpha beta-hydrolase fold family protein) [Colletotrichum incanum]
MCIIGALDNSFLVFQQNQLSNLQSLLHSVSFETRLSLSLGIAFYGLTSALQAANFNFSREFAEANGCGEKCYQLIQLAKQADFGFVGTDFDFDFYATAHNFSRNSSVPGDLLKLAPLDPELLDVRAGTTVYRIQYVSRDIDGFSVPVTGFVALPVHPPKNNTYPLTAFAHGTVGAFRGCAPSSGPSLFDYNSWKLLIDRGFAVVATDYVGLGNNYTEHRYCTFPAHANDVYYSVIAARKVFGSVLSNEWMSVGHSQGGGAVWKLAETDLVRQSDGGKYLGTVSISPGIRLLDTAQEFMSKLAQDPKMRTWVLAAETPYLALALKRYRNGDYNMSILGKGMLQRMKIAEEAQLCTSGLMGLTMDLDLADLYSEEGAKASERLYKEFQEATAPSGGKSRNRSWWSKE